MFAMFSRILKLSGRYKGRIQGAFVCAFLESILSKMPIVLAFVVLSRFAADTLTSRTCLYRPWTCHSSVGANACSLPQRQPAKCRRIFDVCG